MSLTEGIKWTRKWLWLAVEQHLLEAIYIKTHSQVLDLSSDYQDGKSVQDRVYAMDYGQSLIALVKIIYFEFVPQVLDAIGKFATLWLNFGPATIAVLLITFIFFIYISAHLNSINSGKARLLTAALREERLVRYESIKGWQIATVRILISDAAYC